MNIKKPLDVFESPVVVSTLRQMVKLNKAYTGREMAKMINVSNKTASTHLENLWKQDVLAKDVAGKSYSYRLNKDNVIVSRLILEMILLERKFFNEIIREVVNTFKARAKRIILFGSYARDEQTTESDLDICVIRGRALPVELVESLENSLLTRYGITLAIIQKTEKEWSSSKSRLIKNIKKEGKILFEKEIGRG